MRYSPMIGMKTRTIPDRTPGGVQRQGHLAEGRQRAGAKVLGRLQQPLVEPLEADVERQDHQRQVVVDDARARPRTAC